MSVFIFLYTHNLKYISFKCVLVSWGFFEKARVVFLNFGLCYYFLRNVVVLRTDTLLEQSKMELTCGILCV